MTDIFQLTEQNYRYLFENASDAMWVHDMNGNIVDGNAAFEKLTGFSRAELIGLKINAFHLSEECINLAREVRRKLLNGEEFEQPYEQKLCRKDGTIRTLKMSTSLVVIDGEVKGFQHVARDVTEEKRLQENMLFYVQQVTKAQEEERKRIARELHDEVAQSLLMVIQRLDTILSDAKSKIPLSVKQSLEDLSNRTESTLEAVRRYTKELRPPIIDDLGLVAALEWMAEELTKNDKIEATVEVSGAEPQLTLEAQLLLFRIAQESLTNTRRHAEATKVTIRLDFSDNRLKMTISDNGKGFRLPGGTGDLASSGKLGILGMFERAKLAGGSLEINSEPGKGTQVTAEIPLAR